MKEYTLYSDDTGLDYDIVITVNENNGKIDSYYFVDNNAKTYKKLRGEQASAASRVMSNWQDYC